MSAPDLTGKCLLVVEDDGDLREIVADIFRGAGAEVIEAENGRLAFERFREQTFDAVVSDVRMPEEDGVILLGQIRALDRERPPFVFLTGFSDLTPAQALESGAQLTLTKPFDIEVLLREVHGLIHERRSSPAV